jgi:hypothetical protein
MTKTIKTPQDLFKLTTDYFAGYPKTPEEMKSAMEKAQSAFTEEADNVKEVISIYTRASRGDATMNEIASANKKAKDSFVAARFAAFMSMPGAVFMLPSMTQAAAELGAEFVPASVKRAFA